MHILVTGSSGLVGTALCSFLRKKGHTIRALSHKDLLDPEECFDAVVHLAGENLSQGFWTKKKKKQIVDSRVLGTKKLVEQLSHSKQLPRVFVGASAVGFYRESDEKITEESPAGEGFLADLCVLWEQEENVLKQQAVRVVNSRFGYILSEKGGLLFVLKKLFSWGLGSVMGSGKQFMPWVSLEDVVRAIEYILLQEDLQGPVNIVSPHPVTAKIFSKTLARVLHRPCLFWLPEWLIRGEKAKSLILPSLPVFPCKLQKAGFVFSFSQLEMALSFCLRK